MQVVAHEILFLNTNKLNTFDQSCVLLQKINKMLSNTAYNF